MQNLQLNISSSRVLALAWLAILYTSLVTILFSAQLPLVLKVMLLTALLIWFALYDYPQANRGAQKISFTNKNQWLLQDISGKIEHVTLVHRVFLPANLVFMMFRCQGARQSTYPVILQKEFVPANDWCYLQQLLRYS